MVCSLLSLNISCVVDQTRLVLLLYSEEARVSSLPVSSLNAQKFRNEVIRLLNREVPTGPTAKKKWWHR